MLVQHWMSDKLISIDPENSMAQAKRLMSGHHISRLPVIDHTGKLVGIVSDRDLKRASASDVTALSLYELAHLLSKVKVGDIMTPNPLTINEYCTIENAARIMMEHRISGLPVTDDQGEVIAVISQSDILRALIVLTGAHQGGIQIALELSDEPGGIKQLADIIRRHEGRILSILTSNEGVAEGKRKVCIRIKELDREGTAIISKEASQLGKLLYLRDDKSPRGKRTNSLPDELGIL